MSEDRNSQRKFRPRKGGPRRFTRRNRTCQFCGGKVTHIDYKDTDLLRRMINEMGKIRSRRETGTCAKHQRLVARSVKRARHMALLPFTSEPYH
ncbi:MAG: 30S ribosomal protein S18 [Anaerolineales bacterium]|nr:30S ribosomal protein S18 [Anaerolineales bacterium]